MQNQSAQGSNFPGESNHYYPSQSLQNAPLNYNSSGTFNGLNQHQFNGMQQQVQPNPEPFYPQGTQPPQYPYGSNLQPFAQFSPQQNQNSQFTPGLQGQTHQFQQINQIEHTLRTESEQN